MQVPARLIVLHLHGALTVVISLTVWQIHNEEHSRMVMHDDETLAGHVLTGGPCTCASPSHSDVWSGQQGATAPEASQLYGPPGYKGAVPKK